MFVGPSLISWNQHDRVSNSSVESEYRALSDAVLEIMWLRYLLADLWVDTSDATPLYCDNTVAIHIANNSVFHKGL